MFQAIARPITRRLKTSPFARLKSTCATSPLRDGGVAGHSETAELAFCRFVVLAFATRRVAGALQLTVHAAGVVDGLAVITNARLFVVVASHCVTLTRVVGESRVVCEVFWEALMVLLAGKMARGAAQCADFRYYAIQLWESAEQRKLQWLVRVGR